MTTFALWIRAETAEDAAAKGKAWADEEPNWTFAGVVSVEAHPEFYGVWTATVAAEPVEVATLTLGLA